jgi:hypothetical protein
LDVEQYDPKNPEKYLMGILHKEQEPWVGHAFQSYLAVLPSPLVAFDKFSEKVKEISMQIARRFLAGAIRTGFGPFAVFSVLTPKSPNYHN